MGILEIKDLLGSGLMETYDAFEAVSERFIKSTELGISPRLLSYYKTQGLMFKQTAYEKHEHLVFNFVEYVWFQIVLDLRKFDIGLSIVKEVRELLDTSVPFDEFMGEARYSKKLLKMIPDEVREEFLEVIHSDVDWKEVEAQVPMNLLSLMLVEAIVKRKHMGLMVSLDSQVYPFSLEDASELNRDDSLRRFLEKTFVSVSITEIIKRFIENFSPKISSDKLMLLDEREAQVISILHEQNVESLTVHLDDKNVIQLIEAQEIYNKLDKESRLVDLIIKNGYQTIELKTQEGRIVQCKNIRKIKPG